jgi:hypothetical protein
MLQSRHHGHTLTSPRRPHMLAIANNIPFPNMDHHPPNPPKSTSSVHDVAHSEKPPFGSRYEAPYF